MWTGDNELACEMRDAKVSGTGPLLSVNLSEHDSITTNLSLFTRVFYMAWARVEALKSMEQTRGVEAIQSSL